MARIGIVTTWFDRGAAYVSRAFRDALERSGHEVFIYARGGETTAHGDPRWDGPKVHWAKRLPVTQVDPLEFEGWHTKHQLQAVIFNEQQDWPIIDFCKERGIKIVGYIDYYKKDTISLFDKYDALICNTRRHYGVFKNHRNAKFVQWGTDVELFKPGPKPDELKDKIVFFHNGGMLGVNGRKGTQETVNAFIAVASKYPEALLFIHSQVPLGIQHPQIALIAGSFPPPGFYSCGDVYVYPSKLEGIGLTIAEAMASGLPVITTNQAPMNEFVEDGVCGRLVNVDSVSPRFDGYYWPESRVSIAHLAELMQFYIVNPEARFLHAKNARFQAEIKFNWSKNGFGVVDAVESVLS